jgi:DNA mismatch endonuclease (patch repair protein)
MTDHLDKEKRSWNMGRIRSNDTRPEISVRKMLHAAGFRFRLHVKNLPGKPDIVLPKWETIIFVHGCFWHRHEGCSKCTTPSNNSEYWIEKFKKNVERDEIHRAKLKELGWNVIVLWECEVKASIDWINKLTHRNNKG